MAYTPQTSVTDRITRVQGRMNPFEPSRTSARTADGATAIDAGMARNFDNALFILLSEPTWLSGSRTILDCSARA